MKRLSSLLRLSTLSGLALAAPIFAQCPADPSTVMAGKWTFQLTSGANAVGTVTFVAGTNRGTTVFSTQSGNYVYSSAQGAASYVLNATCTGGQIFFQDLFGPAGGGFQANFFINAAEANYGRVITLRATTGGCSSQPDKPLPWDPPPATPFLPCDPTNTAAYSPVGTLWPAVTACPVGVSPINSLSGTYTRVTMSGTPTISAAAPTGNAARTNNVLVGRLVIGSANLGFAPSALDPRGLLTMFLIPTYPANPGTATTSQLPVVPPPAQLPVVSRDGDPGQYGVAADCGSGSMLIYFAWPRPYCIYFYGRQRLNGTIDYVGLGHSVLGEPFATSQVTIAR